ncbi:FtsX-like permease family protein [Microbacterium sp. BLY]|uniref:FtsX-like permease family protein n=1 Tax=Microbacterium sp. BLY TaxID=2823280 RepID=UPI001B32FE4F|nr:ABC transporter permease [Microbacterium sp. BLY]MBP3978501.1 ABC transporter permease [Microbacterium sp. BLY]
MILVTVGAGTSMDVLLRSAQTSDETYARLTLGDTAQARVQWFGDAVFQQTPRADVGSGGGRDAPLEQVEGTLRALLPADNELHETRTGFLALRSGDALTDGLAAVEADFTDPPLRSLIDVWQGDVPEALGEASVSRTVAERLNLSVGDTFEGGTDTAARLTALTLVGIHENNALGSDVALADGTLLAVGDTYLDGASTVWFLTGTDLPWADVLTLNDAGFVAISRSVVMDPPDAVEVPIYREGEAHEAAVTLGVALAVTLTAVIGGTIMALLIGPVFAIGARQSRRDYGLLVAQGATGRDIRGVMISSAVLVASLASIAGVLLGLIVASLIVWATRLNGSTAYPNLIVPALDLIVIAVFGVVVAFVAAWAPARRAANADPIASLKDTGEEPRSMPRVRWVLMAVLVLLALTTFVLGIVSGVRAWYILTGPFLTIGLILVIRPILPLLGRVAHRLPAAERVAVRDAVRRADRTIPSVTGTAAAIAVAVAILVVTATQYATVAAEWHPRASEGTIMIYDGFYTESSGGENPFEQSTSEQDAGAASSPTAKQRNSIKNTVNQYLPGTELVDVNMLGLTGERFARLTIDPSTACPAWADYSEEYNDAVADPDKHEQGADVNGYNCQIDKAATDINRQPMWRSTERTNIVVDDGTLVTALGLPGYEQAAEALRSGKIVLTRTIDQWTDGSAHLGIYEEDATAEAAWEQQLEHAQDRGERFFENPPDPVILDSVIADAVVVDWGSQQWQAFIPPQILEHVPLADFEPVVEHVGVIATAEVPLTQTELDELRDRLLLLGIHQVTAARDYSNPGLATTLSIVTVIAALISITATAGTARLALTDMRRDLRVLHDVGASNRTRRRLRTAATLTVGLLGSVIGVLAGVALGIAVSLNTVSTNLLDRGVWELTVPWIPVVLIAIGAPLVAVFASSGGMRASETACSAV